MLQYTQCIAIVSSLLLLLPVIGAHGDRLLTFGQMGLSIDTDKRVYSPGDIGVYRVIFTDSQGTVTDPDLIRATYDSQFIKLEKASEGVYTYTTGKLTQRDHQLGVYAEKAGYNFVQESLTVRPLATKNANDNVKATVVQQGNLLKFRLSSDMLVKNEIYKVRVITLGAAVESILSSSWIKVPNHIGIDLKSVNGSIGPDEDQTIKLVVNGKVRMVAWNAFDLYGNNIYAGVVKVAR